MTQLGYSAISVLVLVTASPARALAQDNHSHGLAARHVASASVKDHGALVRIVREATERFHDVSVAEAEGYQLLFGCVSGPDSGRWGSTM